MGLTKQDAVVLARRIALFNSEAIHYVKNSLLKKTEQIQKKLDEDYEKFKILINSNSPKTIVSNVLANTKNNENHNIVKLDIDLIRETLEEGVKSEGQSPHPKGWDLRSDSQG